MKRMHDTGGGAGIAARVREAIAASAWAPLAGKVAAYLIGFALLALVGSGRLSGWMSPPGRITLSLPAAEAATAAPSASTSAAETAHEAPAAARDAGADADTSAASDATDGGAASAVGPDGKVNLNLAVEEDLRRLPGVGPKRAKQILELRARLGRFKRVEDLLRVKGLGKRSLARIRPLARVD